MARNILWRNLLLTQRRQTILRNGEILRILQNRNICDAVDLAHND